MAGFSVGAGAHERLAPHVGDLRQLASVRRITLDDGQERGVRALAFSTGGGLDFWVLADRSLDIGPLWWRGTPLAWQGPNGFRSAQLHDQEADGGRGFEQSLSGLMVTCGLQHIRQPENGQPLHGRLPLTPARVQAYGEDWHGDEPVLFCEGEVTEASLTGGSLRLHRRIEAPIGGNELRIIDEVENLAAAAQTFAMLYHLNLGYPLVRTGTVITSAGQEILTLDEHSDPSIDCRSAGASDRATCQVTAPQEEDGSKLALTLGFATATLPYLQVWQDMRPHRRILALEPATSMRLADGQSGPGPVLAPRGRSAGHLTIRLCDDPPA